MNFSRFFHTVKYLKLEQIYYRIKYRFTKAKVNQFESVEANYWKWSGPCIAEKSVLSSTEVRFLNKLGTLKEQCDWNNSNQSKLWLYNLHYFDDLNATDFTNRKLIHLDLINRWIEQNPAVEGNGWEPYPISLRLVNWIKWMSRERIYNPIVLNSIAQQADVLSQRLEKHILGNHLFANGKALIFVGCFLQEKQGYRHILKGLKIINEEIDKQFLNDGAHFELSPMYHEILLWDLLELIELALTCNSAELVVCLPKWRNIAEKALKWLSSMIHDDGEVSFFNDSAIGIAMQPQQIFSYAQKLKLKNDKLDEQLITNQDSGYSRITFEQYVIIFDHANIGPDYLPGHAHADSLSFEFSMGKQRIFVNSGTSLYGTCPERIRQRQTPAHNTVSVECLDSSQVWSGFRVAKRAYTKLEKSTSSDGKVELRASHDGYMKQSPKAKHTRAMSCSSDNVIITDVVSKPILSCFHLHIHQDVNVIKLSDFELKLMKDDQTLCLFCSSEPIKINESTWHPEFGKSIPNKKIEIEFSNGQLRTEIKNIKRDL